MSGKIYFKDAKSLAEFLKHFTGATAVFKVVEDDDGFVLEFTGGY